jgi:DGQHR domain-containing protein
MGFDDENSEDFDLIVSIFVDLPLESQAILFSTINLRQTKVTTSLMYDLFEVAETPSPQKTGHNIAVGLNREEDSPFYRRIKISGVNPKVNENVLYRGRITQGTFVKRLLPLMTKDEDEDRNYFLKGEIPPPSNDLKLVFRDYMRQQQDHIIHRIMKNYFSAVRDNFPDLWDRDDNPLSKTIGYGALMKILPEIVIKGKEEKNLSYHYFYSWLNKAKSKISNPQKEFTFDNFPASGAGETKLTKRLRELLGLPQRF